MASCASSLRPSPGSAVFISTQPPGSPTLRWMRRCPLFSIAVPLRVSRLTPLSARQRAPTTISKSRIDLSALATALRIRTLSLPYNESAFDERIVSVHKSVSRSQNRHLHERTIRIGGTRVCASARFQPRLCLEPGKCVSWAIYEY
jgi:hypothetical protein